MSKSSPHRQVGGITMADSDTPLGLTVAYRRGQVQQLTKRCRSLGTAGYTSWASGPPTILHLSQTHRYKSLAERCG
jgi:hypothetical protein